MELNIRLNKSGGDWDFDLLSNFEIEELKEWGFKEIELGLNIDKIDDETNDDIVITIKENDAVAAKEIYNELEKRGFDVKIKL